MFKERKFIIEDEPIPLFERTKDGFLKLNMCSSEATDHWLRAARLQRLADAGNEEAAAELKRMEETKHYRVVPVDEEE